MMKNLIYVLLSALLIGNAFFGYRLYSRETPKDTEVTMEKLQLLMDVFQQVRANYVDEKDINIDELFDNAIKGMVFSLDPFSEFMNTKEFQDFQRESHDTFGGIGVQIHMQDGLVTVSSALKNTPAAAAGVLAGDQIIAVDDTDTTSMKMENVVKLLRGEPGTKVTITVRRSEEPEPIKIEIIRAMIENLSVSGEHIIEGTKTGYVRIETFLEPTAKQFEEAVKSLEVQGIDSLIIDLRDNPGGQVDSSVDILSYLLPPNSLVATLEGRTPQMNHEYTTHATGYRFPADIPIVVLGNRGTASAAEITISCLRDYHRAAFIGERTFGKALVQDIKDLPGGNAVKFTVAKYYTKLRTPIQGLGIRPDIEDKLTRKDIKAIFEAKSNQESDQVDPNIKTALKFFADGAEWTVYEGKPEGDYDDVLPQWQRDENRRYRMYEYDIYGDMADGEKKPDEAQPAENESTEEPQPSQEEK